MEKRATWLYCGRTGTQHRARVRAIVDAVPIGIVAGGRSVDDGGLAGASFVRQFHDAAAFDMIPH